VTAFLQYVIAGLVTGGIYAISASSLVVTYQSAGILNFAFAAQAFAIARLYYYLNTEHGWGILPAAVVSILVVGPALGIVLYLGLFRMLRLATPLTKIVATVGLSVALVPAVTLLFGNQPILSAPGLAPEPVHTFSFIGVTVTMDQVIVYGCVLLIVVVGGLAFRFTDIGLQVRAMVDSPAMTSLSGTSPGSVSMGVWAVSTMLAGLVGVLAAPIVGLDPGQFSIIMVTAFAAVIAARFRNLPVAVAVGLLIGVLISLLGWWLPPNNPATTDVLQAIPFGLTALFLLYFIARRAGVNEADGIGGALDRAIRPQGESRSFSDASSTFPLANWRLAAVGFGIVCLLPLILGGIWVGLVGQGIALAIIFLSFTLVTGEGGMIWLCQATFAGIGAVTAAQLATNHGWPVMLAVLIGGLVATPIGLAVGLLTIRLGNLYVALTTLTFGLLVESLIFSRNFFQNNGLGVSVAPPQFAASPRGFSYLALAVFALLAIFVVNLRRSTSGLALRAVRSSEAGSRTIGISVLKMKLLLAGLGAFVAGIGGAMYALSLGVALPTNYTTAGGEVWLAILVTLGIRSNVAALNAGLASSLLAGIALVYLPSSFSNFIPIVFGLGAISVARYPDGVLSEAMRRHHQVWAGVKGMRKTRSVQAELGPPPAAVAGSSNLADHVQAGSK
jgi:branched-chain amino acid transport system permease protein